MRRFVENQRLRGFKSAGRRGQLLQPGTARPGLFRKEAQKVKRVRG